MSEATAIGRPSAAGIYDYHLGGAANGAADRVAAERLMALCPEVVDAVWANRGFLQRAVRWLTERYGVRQFLDLGAGLPTQRHTHEVVADAGADGRVVYVDNDRRVVDRGLTILSGLADTAMIHADIREPDEVLGHPHTQRLIDPDQPVGLLLVSVTQFLLDTDDPWGVVRRYLQRAAAGSWLVLSALTRDGQADRIAAALLEIYEQTATPVTFRTRAAVDRFFDGLEIVPPYQRADPMVTYVGRWGAEDPAGSDGDGSRWFYAAVARKP
ncbi:MAG: hypothetical protein GEV12_21815 [Micromonosporaceae bacterium]|nr:hypothetical protein [Micromonosporaceae bacterium]